MNIKALGISMLVFVPLHSPKLYAAAAPIDLLKNGDFAQIEKDLPVDWLLDDNAPETYEIKMVHDVQQEPNALFIRSIASETGKYLSQAVTVRSDADYLLSAKIRQKGGRGLLFVTGTDANGQPTSVDARTYMVSSVGHPLCPDFVPANLMRGSSAAGWHTEEVKIHTPPNMVNLQVHVGVYFAVGEMWIGGVKLVDAP